MAIQLMRQGIRVRLVDRLPAPEPISKAFVIHARTLEIFEQMGVIEDCGGNTHVLMVCSQRTSNEVRYSTG
jgi:2-polyprenyl-6-methoxyphenol hydroxylase-like FAD-dependent oxidoreductase